MHTMAQLKQLREHMVEELTHIPQYRALKAMERFIAELNAIYETPPTHVETERHEFHDKISQAIENRLKAEAASAGGPKVTPYIPSHRVA
jgi:hypothetical protein